MAHGGSEEWDAAVLQAVEPLRRSYPLEVAFGMADAATLQEGVRRLEAAGVARIGVVRLFVSGESWYERTEQILGLAAGAPPRVAHASPAEGSNAEPTHSGVATEAGEHAGSAAHSAGHAGIPAHSVEHGATGAQAAAHSATAAPVEDPAPDPPAGRPADDAAAPAAHGEGHMQFWRIQTAGSFALSTEGLAEAGEIEAVLLARARALSREPGREDLLLLAHGPGDDEENDRWIAQIGERAESIRREIPFRRLAVMTLREDWTNKRPAAEAAIRAFVQRAADEHGVALVVPFRVQGFGPYEEVLEGLEYRADGVGLLPSPAVTRWIHRQAATLRRGPFRNPLP